MLHETVEEVNKGQKKPSRIWRWLLLAVLLVAMGLGITAYVMLKRVDPILKGRVIETLSTRFDARVELGEFHVSLGRGLEVSGDGLKIYPPDDVVAKGANYPEFAVRHFEFHSGLRGLFLKPMRVSAVHVTGLEIHIPPRELRHNSSSSTHHNGKMKIVVGEIICDDSHLIIDTLKPGKDPKNFILQHIVLNDVGPAAPWEYDATLVNAIPKGDIHAQGRFGPWNTESPGDSTVTGHYTFENADLNTIHGLGGTLFSVGDFTGVLNKIAVQGTTDTPNFSLDTANAPMPLHTNFQATVDGTSGDTYLDNVQARLGDSDLTAKGLINNVKGKGHITDLDVTVPNGRIQDFLKLAVKSKPVIMTGGIGLQMKLHIPYGTESVSKKMSIKADFTLQQIHFSNPQWQDKVDMLSLRAQGDPKEAKPGAEDVKSHMKGRFTMDKGKLNFSTLTYDLPGAEVRLLGVYSLNGDQFDFRGNVQTQAKLSQMVASRWKSFLLKAVDPFFTKDGKGTELPVSIQGTRDAPKFGLDMKHRKEDEQGALAGKSKLQPVPSKGKDKDNKKQKTTQE